MSQARWVDPIVLLLLGGMALWGGARLIWSQQDTYGATESGGWIFLLGAILLALTAVLSLQMIATGCAAPVEDTEASDETAGFANLVPVAVAFGLAVAFVIALEKLGYMLSAALFFAIYLGYFGHYRWLPILGGSAAFAVTSAYLWSQLNMMLPQGLIPWP